MQNISNKLYIFFSFKSNFTIFKQKKIKPTFFGITHYNYIVQNVYVS